LGSWTPPAACAGKKRARLRSPAVPSLAPRTQPETTAPRCGSPPPAPRTPAAWRATSPCKKMTAAAAGGWVGGWVGGRQVSKRKNIYTQATKPTQSTQPNQTKPDQLNSN
jgi:hypothetical protein